MSTTVNNENAGHMFAATCMLSSELRNIDKAIAMASSNQPIAQNLRDPAIKVRDAIYNAMAKHGRSKKMDVSNGDAINELMYEAGRDGFVEAVAQMYGPSRVTGNEKVALEKLVDTMRANAPFGKLVDPQSGNIMVFIGYMQSIMESFATYAYLLHAIVR